MKTFATSLMILFCLLFAMLPQKAQAGRGDLISYEELAYYDSDDVVDFFTGQFSQYLNPEENPEFFTIAQLYFRSLIDQRNITVYKLIYETVDFDGGPAQASGIILIPDHDNFDCTKSFSLYAHGTVFAREGVNSRPQNWGGEYMLTLMMASINTITVAPDYYGLGDGDGFHHHSHYQTNSTSCLDMVRAGRNLCDILGVNYNNRLMPMGYSEGGHASMSIARMVREEGLQNEFAIRFIGAGSGAYDMSGEAFNFIVGDPYYPTRQYILYQVASCEDMYGDLIDESAGETYSTYLKHPYDELYVEHVLGQTGNMGWVPSPWPGMFQPGIMEEILQDPAHPFRQCLARSNVYDWLNTTPTFMYYCVTDEQVPYTASLKTRDVQRSLIPWYQFWTRFRIQALDLTLGNTIPDHATCALPSIFVQLAIMSLNLGLDCEYTGKAVQAAEALRTPSGEFAGGKIVHSPKQVNWAEHHRQRPIASVTGGNMQTGQLFRMGPEEGMLVEENGFYIFHIRYENGEEAVTWMFKADPDYVPTDDYNPLSFQASSGNYRLDLSLLEEEVRQVAVLDESGAEWLVIGEGIGENVEFALPETAAPGRYTVEVRTARNSYPLLLEWQKAGPESLAAVYPNPAVESVKVRLEDCGQSRLMAEFTDASGRTVYSTGVQVSGCEVELPVNQLAPGAYVLQLRGEGESWRYPVVRQ